MNKIYYILKFDEGEYVESYDIVTKSVVTTEETLDARSFNSKIEAEYIAGKIGCKAIEA